MYTLTFSECCHVALRVAILRPAEPSIAVGEKALQRSLAKAYGGPEAGGQKPHQVGHKKPGLLGTESLWPLGHLSQLCAQGRPGPSSCSWVSGSRGRLEWTKLRCFLLTIPRHSSPATFSPFLSTPALPHPRVFVNIHSFL